MNTPSHSLRERFEAALALPEPARAAFLQAHCSGDERIQLERMLRADEDAGDPVSDRELDRLARAIGDVDALPVLPAGSRIGPFELVRVIGEGGSSTVFHATRTSEGATQHVALKLMRQSLHSPESRRRFSREQRALIQLRQPNIARMIEGGVTDTGLPYIALELVAGTTITEHAAGHRLDLRARLGLFVVVCRAVDAAHRALIVHRDLKPSNVLVTDDGEVKLLDFGVAKLLADEEDEGKRTLLPAFTPAYAAPEQRSGATITTATDVYALGVLLGELVTGRRVNDSSGRTPSSQIREPVEPGVLPASVQATRRQVRGDLDAIMLKAVDADPARRYASAGALADEIERHLAGQPVGAQPPTRWYRAGKFVRRHKGGVASTAAFLLATFAALGIAVWQAQVAREQARIARSESSRANATRAFVVELLKTASAELPKDQRPTPEALVEQAARQVREDADLDPVVRAQLLLTLGEIARSHGDNVHAENLINEAIERERELGVAVTSPEWISALTAKGNLLHSTGRSAEADRLMEDLLPRIEGVDSEDAVSALMLHGATRAYAGDADRAMATARRALAKAQRVFGPDSVNGIETATYLGQLSTSLRRYRESAVILEDTLARWRRLQLPLNEQYARSLFHLAFAKHQLGERAEVEPLYAEGIALMRRVRQAPYHRLSQGLVGHARFLMDEDRFEEAQAALDEALSIERSVFGEDNSRTATTLDLQGQLLGARHQYVAAEAAARSAHDALQRNAEASGYEPEAARARLHLSSALLALGRLDEADSWHSQAMPALESHYGAGSPEVASGLCLDGQIALNRSDADRALASADQALAVLPTLDFPAPQVELSCRILRTNALLRLARTADAQAEVRRALVRLHDTTPNAGIKRTRLLALRARVEHASGDAGAALATIAQARALGIPPDLLAAEDRETLGVTTPR